MSVFSEMGTFSPFNFFCPFSPTPSALYQHFPQSFPRFCRTIFYSCIKFLFYTAIKKLLFGRFYQYQICQKEAKFFIVYSFEYNTFNCLISLFFSYFIITLANGHTDVFFISAISNLVGSNLFPVPIQDNIGI